MTDVPTPHWSNRYPLTRVLTPDQRRAFLVRMFGDWAMIGFGIKGLKIFPKAGVSRPPP